MFFAAAPPDVREVFNLPEQIPPIFFRAMPPCARLGHSPEENEQLLRKGIATSAHRAAQPQEKHSSKICVDTNETSSWHLKMWLGVRTEADLLSLVSAVREQVKALDKDLPLPTITTLEHIVGDSISERRFNLFLLSALALVAMVLAGVGIYGVMAQSVSQRTHEIGIRMALGARAVDVLRLVMRQSLALTLSGAGVGLVGAWVLTRVLAGLLFGVSATDPVTFALITLLLIGVAVLAGYLPARRAARVDPMVALRHE